MKRVIIAAMSKGSVIGSGNGMPWHVPAEYQHFLDSVRGHTMIMGRKSWEIFGGDVATAHNIVVSGSSEVCGAEVANSLFAAIALAESYGKTIFIAGGASIYQQSLDSGFVDEMHLSTIHGEFTGDTYFPAFDKSDWQIVENRVD